MLCLGSIGMVPDSDWLRFKQSDQALVDPEGGQRVLTPLSQIQIASLQAIWSGIGGSRGGTGGDRGSWPPPPPTPPPPPPTPWKITSCCMFPYWCWCRPLREAIGPSGSNCFSRESLCKIHWRLKRFSGLTLTEYSGSAHVRDYLFGFFSNSLLELRHISTDH